MPKSRKLSLSRFTPGRQMGPCTYDRAHFVGRECEAFLTKAERTTDNISQLCFDGERVVVTTESQDDRQTDR